MNPSGSIKRHHKRITNALRIAAAVLLAALGAQGAATTNTWTKTAAGTYSWDDTLSAQSVTLYPDCHFAVTLNGAQAQTNYDQLLARSGTLTLGNSTLDIALGYAPTSDTTFTIIKNESGNPVSGTFAGLPEGATVSAPYNGRVYVFRIRYNVGAGKDVVLQAVPTGTVFKFCLIAHRPRAQLVAAPARADGVYKEVAFTPDPILLV